MNLVFIILGLFFINVNKLRLINYHDLKSLEIYLKIAKEKRG